MRTVDPYEQQFLSLLVAAGLAMYRQRAKEAARAAGREGAAVRVSPSPITVQPDTAQAGVSHPALINHADA